MRSQYISNIGLLSQSVTWALGSSVWSGDGSRSPESARNVQIIASTDIDNDNLPEDGQRRIEYFLVFSPDSLAYGSSRCLSSLRHSPIDESIGRWVWFVTYCYWNLLCIFMLIYSETLVPEKRNKIQITFYLVQFLKLLEKRKLIWNNVSLLKS